MDKLFKKHNISPYLISLLSVGIVALIGLLVRGAIDYRILGYILLVLVSILAIFFKIKPVLLAAVLSALALDFYLSNPTTRCI